MISTNTPPQFEALYRFPHRSKKWKSVGIYATYEEARIVLDGHLDGCNSRTVDRWIHQLPAVSAEEAARPVPLEA